MLYSSYMKKGKMPERCTRWHLKWQEFVSLVTRINSSSVNRCTHSLLTENKIVLVFVSYVISVHIYSGPQIFICRIFSLRPTCLWIRSLWQGPGKEDVSPNSYCIFKESYWAPSPHFAHPPPSTSGKVQYCSLPFYC